MASTNDIVKPFKQSLNPYSVGLMLCLIGYLVFDISQRFIMADSRLEKNDSDSTLQAIPSLGVSASQREQLERIYAVFVNTTDEISTDVTTNNMSPEEQLQQQGFLKQIFVGNQLIKLKAVIEQTQANQPSRLVLLDVEDLETKQKKILSISDGAVFEGYKMVVISNTKVSLSRLENRNDKSELMLVMYESVQNHNN